MLLLKIAFRNVLRQKRRSILTGLMMTFGFWMISITFALSDGMYGSMIEMFTLDHTGHVQVHKDGYLDKKSLYNTIDNADEVIGKIVDHPEVVAASKRIISSGLVFNETKTTAAGVIGIDPDREAGATRIKQKILEGEYLGSLPEKGALVGNGIRKILKLNLGDELVIISQAADGSIANDLFNIVGFVGGESDTYNRDKIYLHIADAEEFFVLQNRVHEIVVALSNYHDARRLADDLNSTLDGGSLDAQPWQVVEKDFYRAMQADQQGGWITLVVIMIIVAIGVLNTVLMSILERRREFGVLRAFGTHKLQVALLIVLESVFLSFIGIAIGMVVSLISNYWLTVYGIKYPEPIEYGGMVFQHMKAIMNARSYWIPTLVVMATAAVVAIFPAIKAARVAPAEAMRTF